MHVAKACINKFVKSFLGGASELLQHDAANREDAAAVFGQGRPAVRTTTAPGRQAESAKQNVSQGQDQQQPAQSIGTWEGIIFRNTNGKDPSKALRLRYPVQSPLSQVAQHRGTAFPRALTASVRV